MNEPEIPQEVIDLQVVMATEIAEGHKQVVKMQLAEAAFKAQAAQRIAERELEITEGNQEIHEKLRQQAANCLRPTAMLRPNVNRDTVDGWRAMYGDVAGTGPTPELACQDFDRKWLGKDEL